MRHILLLSTVLLTACGAAEVPGSVEREPAQGREETRNIRSTEAVGYAGHAVADRVDEALDASERRQEQLATQAE